MYLPATNVFHKIKKVEQFGESVLVTCLQVSQVYSSRFVRKYCDVNLPWYDRIYDFIDLGKWEECDKDKDFYISNVNFTPFSKIYKDIGFKPVNGSLKKTVQFSETELKEFNKNIKKVKLLMNR